MILTILFTSILIILFSPFVYMQLPKFGRLPKGKHLDKIMQSQNYKNGEFKNVEEKPAFTSNANTLKIFWELNRNKNKYKTPTAKIPSVKSDLHTISLNEDYFVWFGHSSYLIQLKGKRFLVDPVFSNNAAPIPFMIKAFKGSNIYTPKEMPHIDYLIITHDHWDHLDYKTVVELNSKVDTVICPLGVGSHIEHWGYNGNKIIEKDWGEEYILNADITLHCVTSHHFSGRGTKRNQTLWASFILHTDDLKIFIGCDGGYGSHFQDFYKKYGAFDLVFLENGQYNKYWEHIHATPEKTIQIAHELHAKYLIPIHSGKFSLSSHSWNEPLECIAKQIKETKIKLIAPIIGQTVYLSNVPQDFNQWWKSIEQIE